jgi:DNA-binding GntR family transcriptional regulator
VVLRLAGKLDQKQRQQLMENLQAQKSALHQDDLRQLMLLDEQMHFMLGAFMQNREIMSAMERLRDKIHQVILRVTDSDRSRPAESIQEHEAIIAAVIDGDAEKASALMAEHLEAGKRRILNPERFSR